MADDGIRVAKAYIDITTNVDETMASTREKVKASAAGLEDDSKNLGASVDKGMAEGIDKGGKSKAAAKKSGEDSGKAYAKGASDEINKDKSVQKAVQTQSGFSVLAFAGMFAGLPAVAAASALAIGASFALLPALFIGIAAKTIGSNDQLAKSWTGLQNHVTDSVSGMAQVMQGPFNTAASDLGASFDRLAPQIQLAMADSVPAVKVLTTSVTDFAENAMPGVLTAVRNSQGPLQGFQSLMEQTGAGVGDMFTNMAKGADASNQAMQTTGGIVRDLTGWLGTLLANLTNGGNAVLPQFRAALGQVEGVITTLTTNGMPALQGASSGFIGTFGGMLGIIGGVASGLGAWAGPLGNAAGSLGAVNTVAKLFGTNLGATGFGLNAFAGSVDAAGKKTTPFGTAMENADKNGTSKFKAGLSSIVDSGFNPLGLAMIGGSLLLQQFGEAQQKAAEKVAEHKQNVLQLTDALRQDSGTMGDATTAANNKALADKNAASNLAVFGGTLAVSQLAIQGNAGAMKSLTDQSNGAIAAIGKQSGLSQDSVKGLQSLNAQLLQNGGTYDDVKTKVYGYGMTQVGAADANNVGANSVQKLTDAQKQQLQALFNGTGAVGEQVKAQADANAAYALSEASLTGLTQAQVANRDATNAATQATYASQDANLALRGAVQSADTAQDNYNKVNANAKSTEDQKAKALLQVEQAFAAEEKAAGAAAQANSTANTAAGKLTDGLRAQNSMAVQLAEGFKGNLPQSLQDTIGKMSVTEAQADGLKVTINKVGQAVYQLPNGKQIVIDGQTQAALDAINGIVRYANGQVAYIHIQTVGGYQNVGVGTGGRGSMNAAGNLYGANGKNLGFAGGGLPMATAANQLFGAQVVQPGDMKWAGDAKVPELFMPLDSSTRSRELLAAANQLMPAPSGSSGGGGSPMMGTTTQAPNVIINVYPPAGASSSDTAQLVSAEVQWALRTP